MISPEIGTTTEVEKFRAKVKNKQSSVGTVHIFENTTNEETKNHDVHEIDTFRNLKSESDQIHIIKQQNKIIDSLSKEVFDLKERLKQEQKDRFKLAIELEQLKRSRFNLNPKSDKAVMVNFQSNDQVIFSHKICSRCKAHFYLKSTRRHSVPREVQLQSY